MTDPMKTIGIVAHGAGGAGWWSPVMRPADRAARPGHSSLWVVVVALTAHGVFDLGHGSVLSNPGVPNWWPKFCLAFDVTAAAYPAWLLRSGRTRASERFVSSIK